MTWPWVSRSRLTAAEQIIEELRRDKQDLRDQMEQLNDRMERLMRVKSGMPRHGKRPTRASIPDEIEKEIGAYESRVVRTQLRAEARAAHAAGEPWEEILKTLQSPAPPVFTPDMEDDDGDDRS